MSFSAVERALGWRGSRSAKTVDLRLTHKALTGPGHFNSSPLLPAAAMSFLPSRLLSLIQRHLPASASGKLCVAFSGGLDSTVLLRALAIAVRDEPGYQLRAIHIDHQLHEHSSDWQRHCGQLAQSAGVALISERVSVALDSDEGIEASARAVRYEAFRTLLEPGETLLTAHHADDQLETVLLALLRSAGVNGLSAMPVCQRFGQGWHLRPLLEFTRAELEAWGCAEQLAWIADPSNDNRDFNRNYLRHEVIPALQRRWPGAALSAVRSAGHLAEAGGLLDAVAAADLADAAVGPCLRVAGLVSLEEARRRNLLRYWLRTRGARPPSTRKLLALEHDMLAAQEDRLPCVDWDGFEVRRYRGLLYGGPQLRLSAMLEISSDWTQGWDWSAALQLPGGLGVLHAQGQGVLHAQSQGVLHARSSNEGAGLALSKLPTHLQVSFRQGGEALRPAGQAHHRKLKKLLQDAHILPWWRSHLPLIHVGDELAAVGDLWIAEEFAAHAGEAAMQVVWEGRPQVRALQMTSCR